MRLLIVTVSAPFGPGEAFAAAELSALRRRGDHVTLAPVRPRGKVLHVEFNESSDMVLSGPLFSLNVLQGAILEALRDPTKLPALLAIIVRSRTFRVLMKNLAVLPKSLWLARYARRAGIDHVHAYWASTPATVGHLAALLLGTPFSLTAHAGDIEENNLLILKSRSAAFVRAISLDGKRRLAAFGVNPSKVEVIHLGVSVPETVSVRRGRHNELAVIVPATLHPKKGHRDLLLAIHLVRSRYPNVRIAVTLAGEGVLANELRATVRDMGLDDVFTFLGQLPHEALLARYDDPTLDVVALASTTRGKNEPEGIPASLIEAMAHGVPVVATDSGGTRELVDEGTGILVPVSDPHSMMEALALLARDPALRNRLALAARRRVADEYEVDRVAGRLSAAIAATMTLRRY